MKKQATTSRPTHDADYDTFEALVADRVAAIDAPLFTTNADEAKLWQAYLAGIPLKHRQHYTCHCCRRFVQRYGGLVTVAEDGTTDTPLWNGVVPKFFLGSCAELTSLVHKARVTGVFVDADGKWGTLKTGEWSHLHGVTRSHYRNPLKTADQQAAEKLQDFIMLKRGMAEVPMEAVVQAVRVLEADAVDRSEKTLGVAQWLLALHQRVAAVKGPARDNAVWLAVTKAPPGWCHVRSTMIATLLDDVVAGLEFNEIKRRWGAKMHPLRYQRPVAPPKEQAIKRGNEIMEKLGAAGSLSRRYAKLEEVVALWRPTAAKPVEARGGGGGAFDSLRKSAIIKPVELPAKKMAWQKFRDEVLPRTHKVEVRLIHTMPFFGMLTAVDPASPPMLQWDGDPRNQASWYFWHYGCQPAQWGLAQGWQQVDAICKLPCHWHSDEFKHFAQDALFVISAARESQRSGGGYFPETLRSEYHAIRSVIEAHSRTNVPAGMDEGTANGVSLGSGLTARVDGSETFDLFMER